VAAGFSPEDADALLALEDAVDLQQQAATVELRHHRTTLVERGPNDGFPSARVAIVEQFGELGFDQYLYATGQPNRVRVSGVTVGSAAEQAGLEPGDVILAAAGQRVYSNRDLYRITGEGQLGDLVPVTVARGDFHVETYVERGPFGIDTDRVSVRPRG
jgi:predicted metalloprotease with PDZ domain